MEDTIARPPAKGTKHMQEEHGHKARMTEASTLFVLSVLGQPSSDCGLSAEAMSAAAMVLFPKDLGRVDAVVLYYLAHSSLQRRECTQLEPLDIQRSEGCIYIYVDMERETQKRSNYFFSGRGDFFSESRAQSVRV